jgi:hypothetical protein
MALLGAVLALPVGGCGAMGVMFALQASNDRGLVDARTLVDPALVPDAAFVRVAIVPTVLAREELPVEVGYVVEAPGGVLFAVDGAPGVVGYCEGGDCAAIEAGPGALAAGQLCPGDAIVSCEIPEPLDAFASAEAHRRGIDTSALRLLLVGSTPTRPRIFMVVAFAIVGLLVILWGLAVIAASRGRQGAPRLSEQRAFVALGSAVNVRARLLDMASRHGFRVSAEETNALVLERGLPEMRARMLGMRSSADVPLKMRLAWTQAPYRDVEVQVRIEEEWRWLRKLPPALEDLVRLAMRHTFELVRLTLETQGGA